MKSMVTKFINVSICLLAGIALVACSTIEEKRKVDYKSTRTLPPLEVPPDLSAIPDTRLPSGSQPSTTTYSAFVTGSKVAPSGAQPSGVLPQVVNMRIERDSQTRWLVVQETPENLWPRVREFVTSAGLVIDRENPATGVIETEWAENRAKVGSFMQQKLSKWLGTLYSTDTRDKFRVRLERGAQPGTTEIYVAHQGMEEVVVPHTSGDTKDQRVRWVPRAAEPDIEAEMLRLLIVYLGNTDEQTHTILSQTPGTPAERAHLTRTADKTALSLDDSLDRAWRRVGLSLDRIGFTVEDRDRSKGIYYVRYIDPDKDIVDKPGFFGRLFGASDKKDNEQYQIHLQTSDAGTAVAVKSKDGAPEVSKTGERILSLLYEQLK